MTKAQARQKVHYHVRDSDSVRPEPYSSPAAARCAMQIRGEPMPGFWVKKIGLRGACPCRQASSVAPEPRRAGVVAAKGLAEAGGLSPSGSPKQNEGFHHHADEAMKSAAPRPEGHTTLVARSPRAEMPTGATDSVSSDRKVQTPEIPHKMGAVKGMGMPPAGLTVRKPVGSLSRRTQRQGEESGSGTDVLQVRCVNAGQVQRCEHGPEALHNAQGPAVKPETAGLNLGGKERGLNTEKASVTAEQGRRNPSDRANTPAVPATTYGHAEAAYLNSRSGGSLEG